MIFAVRVTLGREETVMDKVAQATKRFGYRVYSTFLPKDVRGYIFVEAENMDDIRIAIRGINNARGVVERPVDIKEVEISLMLSLEEFIILCAEDARLDEGLAALIRRLGYGGGLLGLAHLLDRAPLVKDDRGLGLKRCQDNCLDRLAKLIGGKPAGHIPRAAAQGLLISLRDQLRVRNLNGLDATLRLRKLQHDIVKGALGIARLRPQAIRDVLALHGQVIDPPFKLRPAPVVRAVRQLAKPIVGISVSQPPEFRKGLFIALKGGCIGCGVIQLS